MLPIYKIILFDLDDTLLDFATSESKSLIEIYREFYSNVTDDFFSFENSFKTINRGLWKNLETKESSLKPSDIRIVRFEELNYQLSCRLNPHLIAEKYEKLLGRNADWIKDVKPAIEFLSNKNYHLGIVTNGLSSVQYTKYKTHQLEKWFKCFVVSDEVEVSKPDKRIFELALSKIMNLISNEILPHELPLSSVLMVGDSLLSDGKGASNAGIDFCLVDKKKSNDLSVNKAISSVAELPYFLGYTNEYKEYLSLHIN